MEEFKIRVELRKNLGLGPCTVDKWVGRCRKLKQIYAELHWDVWKYIQSFKLFRHYFLLTYRLVHRSVNMFLTILRKFPKIAMLAHIIFSIEGRCSLMTYFQLKGDSNLYSKFDSNFGSDFVSLKFIIVPLTKFYWNVWWDLTLPLDWLECFIWKEAFTQIFTQLEV